MNESRVKWRSLIAAGLLLCAVLPLYGESGGPGGYTSERVIALLAEKNLKGEARPLLERFGGFGVSVHVSLRPYEEPGFLPGEAERGGAAQGAFMLAVPLDAPFAVETALSFIDAALLDGGPDSTRSKNPKTIIVVFLADEVSFREEERFSHKGLRDAISLPDMPGGWAVCYLTAQAAPQSLVIRHGAGDYIAPLELVKPLPLFLDGARIPFSFQARYNELFKLGLIRGSEELALLGEAGMHGVCLYPSVIRRGPPGQGLINAPEAEPIRAQTLGASLYDYAAFLSLPLEHPDQHYTLISLAGAVGFISETALAVFLLAGGFCLLAGILVYSATHRVALISRVRLFVKRGWVFFLFLPVMMAVVSGAGFAYGALHRLLGVPVPDTDFWSSVLVIAVAAWFFYILSSFLNFFHFARKAELYGVSAIIIAAAGVFVSAYLDVTYTAVFLCAFVFSFLGGNVKKPEWVLVCAFLIPLRGLGCLNNIREAGGMPMRLFMEQVNLENWVTAYQIAALCLPAMLLGKRSMILIAVGRHYRVSGNPTRGRVRAGPVAMRFYVLFLILLVMVVKAAFFTDSPLLVKRTRETPEGEVFGLTLEETVFEESRIVNVRLEAEVAPAAFGLTLEGEGGITPFVYSASTPSERQEDNSVRFILGENPPNPLDLEIVLGKEDRVVFRGEAVYDAYEPSLDPEPLSASSRSALYELRLFARPVSLAR